MPIMTYPFTTESNYVKTSMIEFSGGKCQGALQNLPNQDFIENFDNDTGFVYDSDKAEFSGGQVQQINKRPTNAIAYSSYTDNENLNWGSGTASGTLGGAASVSGGALVLSGNSTCDYNIDNFVSMTNVGTIRCRWKPGYTGNAPSVQEILLGSSSTANRINLRHNSNLLQCYVFNSSGSLLCNISSAFSAVADQIYEFELNFDLVQGHYRLYVDGVLFDDDLTGTGTRTNFGSYFRIGDTSGQNFELLDLLFFDTVQHTSNYTPDWTNIFEYDYLGSSVILPEMEWTGVGTLISFDALTYTIGNVPRLSLQIGQSGDYLYWNGSAWVVSNGDYTQASDFATFAANVASLSVSGEIYGQFKLHFNNSNTQSSVSMLTASLTAQEYPKESDAQNLYPTSDLRTDGLENFVATSSTNIKFIMVKDGVDYWYDSANWVTSDGTYSEANTEAELTPTVLALFTTTGVQCYPKIVFGGDGTTQEYIDEITITYNFSGDQPVLDISTIWGYLYDSGGNILPNRPITGVVIEQSGFSSGAILDKIETETLTNSDGYWELEIPYDASVNEPPVIEFNINGTKNKKRMSYQETIKYTDLQDL